MAIVEARSPVAATVIALPIGPGQAVRQGDVLAVVEAMKMEHEIRSEHDGEIASVRAQVGDQIGEGELLLTVRSATGAEPAPVDVATASPPTAAAGVRADLQELRDREAWLADDRRPDAVARRHALGLRTARENIADLCDAGSFVEYGALAIAAQRSRRSLDDLVRHTPADGMVTGIGTINAASFPADVTRAVVMAYDATVLAGTQGMRNHQKTDRLLGIAAAQRLPVVLFAEGGGGRPGDVDMPIVAGLDVGTFARFARLSGRVPVLGIVAGRCFAGNAALLGCCDTIIATRDSSIGMGGPAMVEGGGLGSFRPEEIGPSDVQLRSGVIDVLVADEAEAVAVARRYLGLFQGRLTEWQAGDPTAMRELLPASRLRVYEIRAVVTALVDTGSTLELRAGFGLGVVTMLARVEGRPVGVLASNPAHLGGAIDADAADKAARFMQLCDAHGLPILSLIDTPGFMVGPEIEARGQVRHVSRMFVVAAQLRVPVVAVVLRKAYGLGAMAMAAGGLHVPMATASWPSGEFGAMGLEGAVELGYRKELQAAAEGAEREALRERLVAEQYEKGKALNMATTLEIDAVIDPADTRRWVASALASAKPPGAGSRFIDPW
jgi:acetyl-CoA carboxylase carboxyltransferase component